MGVHVVLILDLLVVLIQTRIVALMTMVDVKAKEGKVEEGANKVSWFDPILLPYLNRQCVVMSCPIHLYFIFNELNF